MAGNSDKTQSRKVHRLRPERRPSRAGTVCARGVPRTVPLLSKTYGERTLTAQVSDGRRRLEFLEHRIDLNVEL